MSPLKNLADFFSDKEFFIHWSSTVFIFLNGLLFSYIFVLFLTLLSSRFTKIRSSIYFIISLLQPIPRIVLFPILLIFFGINDFSRIGLVFLGLAFTNFIIIDTQVEKLQKDSLIKVLNFYKVQPWKKIYFYYFKGCREAIYSTYKNSIGYGLTLSVIAESSFSNRGLGFLIWRYWERYEMNFLFFTILSVSITAIILNLIPLLFFVSKRERP